mmetsp:Transcript_9788/g.41108  ORF Transcript_9788/g.41108 Transcript_9788/m.41108 type:complete len:263 (-) Transcript_9788:306-1094(-)
MRRLHLRHRHACPHGISTTCTGADMHTLHSDENPPPSPFPFSVPATSAGFSAGAAAASSASSSRISAGGSRGSDASSVPSRFSATGSATVSASPSSPTASETPASSGSASSSSDVDRSLASKSQSLTRSRCSAPRSSSSRSSAAPPRRRSHPKNLAAGNHRQPPTTNAAAIFIRFAVVTVGAALPPSTSAVSHASPAYPASHAQRPFASHAPRALQKSSDAHVSVPGLAFGDTHTLQHDSGVTGTCTTFPAVVSALTSFSNA